MLCWRVSTHCNKLQQTVTNCNKLQQTVTNCTTLHETRLTLILFEDSNSILHTHTHLHSLTHTHTYCFSHSPSHTQEFMCKRDSVGQSEGLLSPRSSVRFRLKPENSNSHGFELHRPSSKSAKLLLKVIKSNRYHIAHIDSPLANDNALLVDKAGEQKCVYVSSRR